jgi:hypothetical protein
LLFISSPGNKHLKELHWRCRVCASKIDRGAKYNGQPKEKFKNEFQEIFDLDIGADDTTMHPNKVCDAHVRFFTRYREAKCEGREMCSSLSIHQFNSHSENCEFCHPPGEPVAKKRYTAGRPKKQQATGPQPGKKQILSPLMPAEDAEIPVPVIPELIQKIQSLDISNREAFLSNLCDSVNHSDRVFLAHKLGAIQSDAFGKEAASIEGKYMDIQFLNTLNLSDYVSNMDPVTLSYFDGLCNSSKDIYMTAHIMEILYKIKRKRVVAPLCFLYNLDAYALTGSKQCLERNSMREPSGTYQTVINWIERQASTAPVCPDGDILCIFDNDQVIGKCYFIHPDSKVKSSVITNCAWVAIEEYGTLQKRTDLLPRNWLNSPSFVAKVKAVRESSTDHYTQLGIIHYEQVYLFIHAAIEQVLSEQKWKDGSIVDEVDEMVKQKTAKRSEDPEHHSKERSDFTLNIMLKSANSESYER